MYVFIELLLMFTCVDPDLGRVHRGEALYVCCILTYTYVYMYMCSCMFISSMNSILYVLLLFIVLLVLL